MRRTDLASTVVAVLLVAAGCGSDPVALDEPPAAAGSEDVGAGNDGTEGGAAEEPPPAPVAGGGGSVTLAGTTYEVDTVLDCTVDDPTAPDDRLFIGESADGSVNMSISYFADDGLAGLNGLDLELRGDAGDEDWSTSLVGSDALFTVTPRPDGADGTAEVRKQGPIDDGPETIVADWSFTC